MSLEDADQNSAWAEKTIYFLQIQLKRSKPMRDMYEVTAIAKPIETCIYLSPDNFRFNDRKFIGPV